MEARLLLLELLLRLSGFDVLIDESGRNGILEPSPTFIVYLALYKTCVHHPQNKTDNLMWTLLQ